MLSYQEAKKLMGMKSDWSPGLLVPKIFLKRNSLTWNPLQAVMDGQPKKCLQEMRSWESRVASQIWMEHIPLLYKTKTLLKPEKRKDMQKLLPEK